VNVAAQPSPTVENARKAAFDELVSAYNEDFIDSYALVIAESQELPEQMNNEIRNAFTHLTRIWAASDIQIISDEKVKGLGHIHRATRDCLKYTVFHLHMRLQTQHKWALILHRAVSPEYCARSEKIKDAVKKIIADETKGIATESDWLTVIKESKELSDAYHRSYGIEFKAKRLTRVGYFLRLNAIPVAVGVLGTLTFQFLRALWNTI
jgi:hypothetical protein